MKTIVLRLILASLFMISIASCKKEEAATDTAAMDTSATATHKTDTDAPKLTATLADCSALPEVEYEVDVTFTGLVTFMDAALDVTKPLPDPMDSARNLKVLIPDVKAGDKQPLPPGHQNGQPIGKTTHKHTPFVGTDVQYMCKDSTAELKDSWCKYFAFHELKKEDIQWDAKVLADTANNPSPLQFPINVAGDGICPKSEDMKSLRWMPSLSRIGLKGEMLDQTYLATKMLGTSMLTGGRLEACVLSRQKVNFRPLPTPAPGSHRQVVAEEIHYLLKGKGKTFTVTLKDAAANTTTLVLKPVEYVNGEGKKVNRIELRVGNLPEKYIPVTDKTVAGSGEADKFDAHFGIYHRVLANKNRPKEIPFHDGFCANFPKCRRVIETRKCKFTDGPIGVDHPSTDGANCGPTGQP